jgi:hypothetical protein
MEAESICRFLSLNGPVTVSEFFASYRADSRGAGAFCEIKSRAQLIRRFVFQPPQCILAPDSVLFLSTAHTHNSVQGFI